MMTDTITTTSDRPKRNINKHTNNNSNNNNNNNTSNNELIIMITFKTILIWK